MSEPLEQVRKARPNVEVDPLLTAKVKESLMKEIANGTIVESGFGNTEVDDDARRDRPNQRGVRRHQMFLAVAAALTLIVAGVGAYSIFGRDDGFEVANDEVPHNEVGDPHAVGADPLDSKPVTNFGTSTFKFDVDEIVVSIDGGEDYWPVGKVGIFNSVDLHRIASGDLEIEGNEDTFESVNGFVDPNPNPYVDYDRDRTESLEIEWGDRSLEGSGMLISLGYATNGIDWWVFEVQAHNGANSVRMSGEGEFFRSPLGTAFNGDIEIALGNRADGRTPDKTGKLTLTNATLEPFRTPAECVNSQQPFVLVTDYESIELEVTPSLFYGGFFVGLVDTETCTVASPDEYTISGSAADSEIVKLFIDVVEDGVSVNPRAIKSGQTTLGLEATDNATGTVVASSEISVSASVSDEVRVICRQAQGESKRYVLTHNMSQTMRVGDIAPYHGQAQLWNAETCQPESLENYVFEVVSNDQNVANVEQGVESLRAAGEGLPVFVGDTFFVMTPVNVGEATITMRASDKETGDVVAELVASVETVDG